MFAFALFAFALCATAQGRAVNISNTWVLPEEGFPVFYRYFRDRISWYEADAVCQFHHANLVTVDTTAQYDAVRAYLKELDISSAVWVGLIRSNPDGDFTWTDYRGLGGDGYWSSAPDPRAAPLCAAADPAADYRWEARACGGPTVASFICELPVPQWALGNEGCMVKALPALTVLYLPESAAVQLTADCGLAGVKRVQCTGNVKREALLKDLSCAEDEETYSTTSVGPTGATSTVPSENLFTEQDSNDEVTTEENTTTEHEDDINQSSTAKPRTTIIDKVLKNDFDKQSHIYISKNIDLGDHFNNNLQSNEIPKLVNNDDYFSRELTEKLEDEKNKQHKMLHEEFARHGNFETIFTQPTDHFVPPLVMAKSKISDDMTVLSLEEKHAQQLAEHQYSKQFTVKPSSDVSFTSTPLSTSNAGDLIRNEMTEKPFITTTQQTIIQKDYLKKENVKANVPKKYSDKFYGLKSKTPKSSKMEKTTELITESLDKETSTNKYVSDVYDKPDDEPTIDLTVIIKEPDVYNHSGEMPKIKIIQNDTSVLEPEIKLTKPDKSSGDTTQEISVKWPKKSIRNLSLNHEVIKITILNEDNISAAPTVFEVTTKMPVFGDDHIESVTSEETTTKNVTELDVNRSDTKYTNLFSETTSQSTPSDSGIVSSSPKATPKELEVQKIQPSTTKASQISITESIIQITPSTVDSTDRERNYSGEANSTSFDVQLSSVKATDDMAIEGDDMFESNNTETSTAEDFQSPLLSAANEPLHRPNRSRRPQPPPNRNKFNPFRILG